MFKNHDNKTVSAAILCPSVCVSDGGNKAGRSINYITNQPFLLFICEEQTNMAAP